MPNRRSPAVASRPVTGRSVDSRLVAAVVATTLAMLPAQLYALANPGANPFGAFARASALSEVEVAAATLPTEPVAPAPQEDLAARAGQERAREEDRNPADEAFAERWPAQAAAKQDVRQPDTTRWALIIGINEHMGSVRDNYGSAQDAVELREHLLSLGWRDDHIVLITDLDATRDNMLAGMRWLSTKTNQDSVAVFHYSGHSKKWYDQDHDGDGEVTDEGLWPTDDRFIPDSEFVAHLAPVKARLWVNIGACNSEGFNDPGLAQPGRVLTFSSRELEKSYEDPSVSNSVWGYYLFDEGFLQGYGDTDGDGEITVEEAFAFAKPRAAKRTEGQEPYGNQNAVIIDGVEGDFSLAIPPPPPPPASQDDEEPQQEEEEGGLLCPVLCGEVTRLD